MPYKRKRKFLYDSDGKKSRSRNDDSSDGSDSDHIITVPISNHSVKEEAWHNLAAGIETNNEYQLVDNSETNNCIQGASFKSWFLMYRNLLCVFDHYFHFRN